jgi:cohesin complex subunit SA-1/2
MTKGKTTRPFRELLMRFFKSLINVLHETDVLYEDPPLMENISRWIASMSSSTLRPFRHTATVIALSITNALVEDSKKLDDRITTMTGQIEAERSRKGKAKDRMSATQRDLELANKQHEICQGHVKDYFDTVFVHRYRDIDPKVRLECVEALGTWIWLLPTIFYDPQYLRYMGWMLSDTHAPTRQEVLRQLNRVFTRDADKLAHFIERFKARLVEMATKDADVAVRVTAVSAVETLRGKGMLEPTELDAVGRLVFDSEPRVRKATVEFFSHCLADADEAKVEEIGEDVVEELFSNVDDKDDFDSPRRDWIRIKCLAELLVDYDQQLEGEAEPQAPHGLNIEEDMVKAVAPESRYMLAAQALYERMELVRNWEVLAGYLLYDHTSSSKSNSKSKARSNEATLRRAVAPVGQEEQILLEVLVAAVKQDLTQASDFEKTRKKGTRAEERESQEESAIHLAVCIPRLLKKYGAEPSTATIVLRLEHYLDLDIFQQLRQDSTTYVKLVDEIGTQFDRHEDRDVLTEATTALLHARGYAELEEMVDARIATLWDNVVKLLRNFDSTAELGIRGNLEANNLAQLGHTLLKMSKLAGVSDCTDVLEAAGQSDDSLASPIEILARTVLRGKLTTVDEELDDLEDEAVGFAIRAVMYYFMWKVRALTTAIKADVDVSSSSIDSLAALRKTMQTNLINTLTSRGVNDELRLFATGALCDLHVLLTTLRQAFADNPGAEDRYRRVLLLIEQIPAALVPELIEIFDAAERAYAKKAKRSLNEPGEDEDPIDDEDAFSDDEDATGTNLTSADRKTREVRAERALCDLASKYVLAIVARVVDQVGSSAGKLKRRMLRNQSKLGNNFKEVVAYLDEEKLKERLRPKKKLAKVPIRVPAEELVIEDDDDEEEEDDANLEDPFASDNDMGEGAAEEPVDEPDPEQAHVSADDDVLGD